MTVILLLLAAPAPAQGNPAADSTRTAEAGDKGDLSPWIKRLEISGTLDGELRWTEHADSRGTRSPGASDLYIRLLDLGIETSLLDWGSAIAVLNSERIGDALNPGDERVAVDEVHFDLETGTFPMYLVFGKRTQPFGLFENHLTTDPLTQDAYETRKVALTLGHADRLDSEVSITAYKGAEQMDHLFGAGLFDTTAVRRDPQDTNQVGSFILSGALSPVPKRLSMFGAVLTEPGRGRRNTTLNAGFNLAPRALGKLALDLEAMQALTRETYRGLDREFKERALSVSVTYEFVLKERRPTGSANYKGRKSHIRSHPFEITARYELFDDDLLAEKVSTWSARNRLSLGGRFTFHEEGRIFAYGEAEYRRAGYRVPPALRAAMDRGNNEVFLRLGVDF